MEKFKKYYAIIFILIMIIVISISASYAIFSNTKEEHGKLNIVAGTLDYKIENKYVENDQIMVNANDKITTTFKITSLNTISSKYELYYQIENNIKDVKIGYASNTKDNVKGTIKANETKEIKIIIQNNSNQNVKVTFKVHGGLVNLEYDDIKEYGLALKEIKAGDVILAWTYVGNKVKPSHFPNKGDGYEVESVKCNGKETSFDNYNWKLTLPDTSEEEITCEFVFRDTQTLANKILSSNTLITDTPTLTTSSNNTSDKSGLYASTDTNTGNPTYYFRGNVENNYVSFAGFTWRIVRINGDGTTRIVMQDGINSNTNYAFNSNHNNYSYMYYTNNSNAKTQLESWYQTNIGSKTDLAKNVASGAYYCEQAKAKRDSSWTSGSANMTLYSNYTPDFKCSIDGNGKGLVNASVGLLSYDEVVYAGGYPYSSNNYYYLYNSAIDWWTMSLAGFSASDSTIWIVNTAGIIGYNNVNYTLRLRPVIILNADTLVTGDGTSSDPFVVS